MTTLPYSPPFHITTYSLWEKITSSGKTETNQPKTKPPLYSRANAFFKKYITRRFENKKLTAPYSLHNRFSWCIFLILFSTTLQIKDFFLTYDKWVAWASEVRTLLLKDYSYCCNEHMYTMYLNENFRTNSCSHFTVCTSTMSDLSFHLHALNSVTALSLNHNSLNIPCSFIYTVL